MYDHHFSNFVRSPVPDNLCKVSAPRHPWLWRRKFLKFFTIYGHGCHLGQWTATILAIFHSPAPRRLHMKFEQHTPRSFRGEVVWNSQHFSHTNVWGPYKYIGKQNWPRRKKVKHQFDLWQTSRPWWFVQRFSPKAYSIPEKIFKGFYHIWAWRPSWSMERDHFSNLLFPQPKEAPYEIWAKLAQWLPSRSLLKILTTDARMDDGQKVITIAHPEDSSGELKMIYMCKLEVAIWHRCPCPGLSSPTPRHFSLAPPRGMTLGQWYHTLKGLDIGKCHTKFQLSSPEGIKVISCKRNADVNLHLSLQVHLNLVTNVTYAHTHVRT